MREHAALHRRWARTGLDREEQCQPFERAQLPQQIPVDTQELIGAVHEDPPVAGNVRSESWQRCQGKTRLVAMAAMRQLVEGPAIGCVDARQIAFGRGIVDRLIQL